MACNPRVLNITSREDALEELNEMGIDPSRIDSISGKMVHINLKLENVERGSADILKKKMDSVGGAAAVAHRKADNWKESTDILLTGNHEHFKKLLEKRQSESHGLSLLKQEIQESIDNPLKKKFIIKCKKVDLDLNQRTHIMGIVNVTPDSFSDGGVFSDPHKAYEHALKLVDQGADIIDIGGETTRPGSKPITANVEIDRVVPVIERLARRINVPISIDTYKSHVAEKAIEAGAEIINDISGLHFDSRMAQTAARLNVPVVLMHIKGTPENMQQNPHYEALISEILQYLRESISMAQETGIDVNNTIVDPGIGFGKSINNGHNLKIINKLSEFKCLGRPILVGPSRKAFIGKILDADPIEREEGTAAAVSAAILNGANIVRVHNVGMMRKVVRVIDAIKNQNEEKRIAPEV